MDEVEKLQIKAVEHAGKAAKFWREVHELCTPLAPIFSTVLVAQYSAEKGDEEMMMSTVVAVALGLTPVPSDGSAELITGDYSASVGHYSQVTDRRGTTYVSGRDPSGVYYELVMDRRGYVEADVGERQVSFRVQEAS